MGEECGDHKYGNSTGAQENDFKFVIQKHDGEGKLKYTDEVTKPFGQIEVLKLIFDVGVANTPNKDDGPKDEDAK
jgi:hypothetical protein